MSNIIPLGMNPESIVLPQDMVTDIPMGETPNNLDEEDIRNCVMDDFQNDCKDKTDNLWVEKKEWDIKAYYGVKDAAMMRRPWPGASAYPVPITPTLLDTGHANIKASMRSDDGRWCTIKGVGEEDIRKSKPLESLLNWQLDSQINIDNVQDINIFRTLLHGNGIIKVMQDFTSNRSTIKIYSIDIENFYLPIDAEGVQFEDNHGHVTQLIPLTKNDIEIRKLWGIYKDLDKIIPGARLGSYRAGDFGSTRKLKDKITGLDSEQRNNRETYFMAETYKEYFPKSGSGYGNNGSPSRAGVRPRYLIILWSPNGATIHRFSEMDKQNRIVPFANYDLYPQPGYFFSMSLPEKIKNIQENANYADKQNTDALDKHISPAMFVSDTAELEKARAKRIPGGIYSIGRDQQVFYEPIPPRERGFETQIQRMWFEAEKMTGLIDIAYGGQPKDQTLGQTEIRDYRAGIRFKAILNRFERGFKQTLDLIYHYDNLYMDRRTKVRVLGYADYKTIEEIFPSQQGEEMGLGITGKFDFAFAGAAVTERENERRNKIQFYSAMLVSPDVVMNPHDSWNVKERLAEAYGQRDIETVITKPSQALIFSAQEAIQRVISGQTGIQLRPGIDTDSYIFEIELFMHTETFLSLMPELQMELFKMLKLAYIMRAAEMRAMMDMRIVQQHQMARNQAMMVGQQNGNGTGTISSRR